MSDKYKLVCNCCKSQHIGTVYYISMRCAFFSGGPPVFGQDFSCRLLSS